MNGPEMERTGRAVPACETIEAGRGVRAAVFLHGVGGTAATFRALIERVGAQARALAWNMPGHGASVLADPLTFPLLAAALLASLDRLGVERADLVGHSLGGMLALEFAARHPGRVASLALVATTPAFGSKDGRFEEEFVRARLAPLDAGASMAALARESVAAMVGEAPDAEGVALAIEEFAGVPPAAYRASVRCLVGFDRRADLARLTVPALCIAGEADRNAPARTMQRMAEAIPGGRCAVIAGAGHLPHLERPAAFGDLLGAFHAEVGLA